MELKNKVHTKVDFQAVIKSYGFDIQELKTFRRGQAQLVIGESCVPNQPIVEVDWYVVPMYSKDFKYSAERPDCIEFESIIDNRVDLWWARFVADFQTKMYMKPVSDCHD